MQPVLSQDEGDLTACFAQDIAALLATFPEKDNSGKQSLQQMISADAAAFSRAALRVLATSTGALGARYVVHLLRKYNLLMEALADPRNNHEDAVGAARVLPQIGAPIDADLENALSSSLAQPNTPALAARVMRLLDLLEAASPQPRFYLFQTELMGHADASVRSRSALLIARTSRSPSVVGKMLLDDDPRVQANAVEALWSFDASDARPLLENAARSRTPRVAANAAVGLYKAGDLSALRLLRSMAEHEDAARRTSAAWAMGETGDPRFLPFLTAWFPRSAGPERVHILQALGRIRRRERALAETGHIEIQPWERLADGTNRRLVFTLWTEAKSDLTTLKATDFALWEGSSLVEDYQLSAQPNPALAICGFVIPRFPSELDEYGAAVREAIEKGLKYKRPSDLWRLDRYLMEPRDAGHAAPLEKAPLPCEEATLGPFAKTHQRGFLAAAEALRRILETAGPRDRAADDPASALERQAEAIVNFSGKRRLFLFLPPAGVARPGHLARLKSLVTQERIEAHGFALESTPGCEDFQSLCLASEGGSFALLPPGSIVERVEKIQAQSLNRYELHYRLAGPPAEGALQITSAAGCGRTAFSFAALDQR